MKTYNFYKPKNEEIDVNLVQYLLNKVKVNRYDFKLIFSYETFEELGPEKLLNYYNSEIYGKDNEDEFIFLGKNTLIESIDNDNMIYDVNIYTEYGWTNVTNFE